MALAFVAFESCFADETFLLSMNEVTKLALENNADVQLALLDYEIASAEAEAGFVDFDTHLTLIPSYKEDIQLPNSTLDSESYRETTGGVSLGLKRKFGLGTLAEVTVQELRLTSQSQQALATERYQGAGQIKVTQPLLKGGWKNFNEATSLKSQLKKERYYWNLLETIDKQITKILGLYWDFRTSEADVRIKVDSVQFYDEKLKLARERKRLGKGSEIEVLQAQADKELKSAELIVSQANRTEAEEKLLRELVPLDKSVLETQVRLASQEIDPAQLPAVSALSSAENSRLKEVEWELKESEVDLRKAENAVFPQLDLAIQYTSTGIGNSQSEAEQEMFSRKYPGWAVILNFSMPLENHAGSGGLQKERATHYSRQTTFSKEKATLEVKLQRHTQMLSVLRERLANLRSRVQRQEEILKFKEMAFQLGRINYIELRKELEKLQSLRYQAEDATGDLAKEWLASQADAGRLALSEKNLFLKKLASD